MRVPIYGAETKHNVCTFFPLESDRIYVIATSNRTSFVLIGTSRNGNPVGG